MSITLNHTHDVHARSWVESANATGADFPIQNLTSRHSSGCSSSTASRSMRRRPPRSLR